MDQIKAEWFLFHIMYVTRLFFLGHMTHFVKVRHICVILGIYSMCNNY